MSDSRTNEYLSFLAERNKQKKLKNAKSKKELEDEEKERGFNTHFRGANAASARSAHKVDNSPYPSKVKAIGGGIKKMGTTAQSPKEEKIAAVDRRKGWGSSSNILHDSLDGKPLEWLSPARVERDSDDARSERSSAGSAFLDSVVQKSISTSPKRKESNAMCIDDSDKSVSSATDLSSILKQVSALRESQQLQLMKLIPTLQRTPPQSPDEEMKSEKEHEQDKKGADRPDWMTSLQPTLRPGSARYSSYNLEGGKPESPPSSERRIAHRKRREARANKEEEGEATFLETSSRSVKEDNIVRKSIDAVTLADRSSRGRLSRSNLHVGIGEEPTLSQPSSVVSPQQQGKQYVPSLLSGGGSNRGSRTSLLGSEERKKRNTRIDEVQEVVAGALAGLANIMGDVRKHPSQIVQSRLPSPEQLSSSTPSLPRGQTLKLEIFSTWGDAHYIGVNGIDIFDENGMQIIPSANTSINAKYPKKLAACQSGRNFIENISAEPADINVLPEYEEDPRVVSNLIDGVSFTRDDLHVWLAPLLRTTENNDAIASVTLTFQRPLTLSMIRVWNYNKSRTYSSRGVRWCRMYLDDVPIFEGEIKSSQGNLSDADQSSEVILFTTNEDALQQIAKHDEVMGYFVEDCTAKWVQKLQEKRSLPRPSTAERRPIPIASPGNQRPSTQALSKNILNPYQSPVQIKGEVPAFLVVDNNSPVIDLPVHAPGSGDDDFMRELEALGQDFSDTQHKTNPRAALSPPRSKVKKIPSGTSPYRAVTTKECSSAVDFHNPGGHRTYSCTGVQLVLESTHGDTDYIGLCGLEFRGQGGKVLECEVADASPRDMGDVGYSNDPRTPDKLLNGVNNTTDDANMWLIPFAKDSHHSITCTFRKGVESIIGFQVWNFNKAISKGSESESEEAVLRGVRVASVFLVPEHSSQPHFLGRVLLRRAPGCDGIHFAQNLFLDDIEQGLHLAPLSPRVSYITPRIHQDYEPPLHPTGMLWKFTFYENWNDPFFMGLDGIEMFDDKGTPLLPVEQSRGTIDAAPHSLADIDEPDDRVPETLLSRDTSEGNYRPWLCPLSRCMTEEERAKAHARICPYSKKRFHFPNNVLFVLFHKPVTLSYVRFFNYSKHPARGVKLFGLEVDGRCVFMGSLKGADQEKTLSGAADGALERQGQSVVFSVDPKIVASEKARVFYSGVTSQDVLCINERKVMVRSKDMYQAQANAASEGIKADLSKRPKTSMKRK